METKQNNNFQEKFEKGQFVVINNNDICRFGEVRNGKLWVENHLDLKYGNFYGTPSDTIGELSPNAEMYSEITDIRPATEVEINKYYTGMSRKRDV